MGTPYKMNGFSGFGNSPVKQVNKGDTLTATNWKQADDEVTNLKKTRNIEGLNKRHGVTYTKKNNSNVYTDASGKTVKENESTYLTPQTDKNSPMKQDTDREKKIARNTEFNAYARKTGLLPTFKSTEEKEKWYSNKANVNMLNKKQAEYFKK
jgi:hypothetical protein